MIQFNVLNRNLNIFINHLLEASAGTGKTFSIENIVTRLLIENDSRTNQPKILEQILVVTFTRAATRDLKLRIRTRLEQSIAYLNREKLEDVPDYLQWVLEQGKEAVDKAKKRLERALATFDQAHIYTIHSFCLRMLTQFVFESDFYTGTDGAEENTFTRSDQIQLIQDFFRTSIHPNIYSSAQIEILLKNHKNNIDALQQKILNYLNSDYEFVETSSFSNDLSTFQTMMREIKLKLKIDPDYLIQDFEKLQPYYKILKNTDIQLIYRFLEMFRKDSWNREDFDLLIREGLLICEFFKPENINKKKLSSHPPKSSLFYPDFIIEVQNNLAQLVEQARSYEFIFSRLLYHCCHFFQKYMADEEKYRESDLLNSMIKALKNPQFLSNVQSCFSAAIIDEFQDTDPIQWEIFKQLFLNQTHHLLYLVGDPKQSIYAFRQADIYTYLDAAKSMGDEHQTSLAINYRSQPSMIKGLNTLFSQCANLFCLPRLSNQEHLKYPTVEASPQAKDKQFSDSLCSIHFFEAKLCSKNSNKFPTEQQEEDLFFPFMTQEMLRLNQKDQVKFNQIAVLIKDKFQAQRLSAYLDKYNIPFTLQRQNPLNQSLAWDCLKELLVAVLQPRNESYIKIALGGPIFGWNHSQIQTLNIPSNLENLIAEFYHFKDILLHEGFGKFIDYVLHSRNFNTTSRTAIETLLSRDKGDLLVDELHQISALLMEHENEYPGQPHQLVSFLEDYKNVSVEEEVRLKNFSDPTKEAVSILTTHNSKGLEYDIVFAYGMIHRTPLTDLLIPQKSGQKQRLIPHLDYQSDACLRYCEELDAEKMRQLYVAFTRAKYRLYIPSIIDESEKKSVEYGCASPMDLFLTRFGQAPCNYSEMYQRIEQNQGIGSQNIIKAHLNLFSYTYLNDTHYSLNPYRLPIQNTLIPPHKVHVPGKPSYIYSFTSLSKQKNPYLENPSLISSQQQSPSLKNFHCLPSNHLTGKLLHKILEIIPFSNMTLATLKNYTQALIQGTHFEEWEDVIHEIILRATNIHIDGFALYEISSQKLYREIEFLYPFENELFIEELTWNKGFLKGVIDLVFFHQDQYYLVDWKSNWLGPDESYYTQKAMNQAIIHHRYDMQALIYQEALKRYLKLFDPRPFEEIFGGCYYIFLRGLNSNHETSNGIFKFL